MGQGIYDALGGMCPHSGPRASAGLERHGHELPPQLSTPDPAHEGKAEWQNSLLPLLGSLIAAAVGSPAQIIAHPWITASTG